MHSTAWTAITQAKILFHCSPNKKIETTRDKFITPNSSKGSRITSLQTSGIFAAFLLVGKNKRLQCQYLSVRCNLEDKDPNNDSVDILLGTSSNNPNLMRGCYVTLEDAAGQYIIMMEAAAISPLMQKKFAVGTPFKKQDAGDMTTFIQDADKDDNYIMVNFPAVYPVNYEVDKIPGGAINDQVTQAIYSTHREAAATWLTLTVAWDKSA